MKQGLCSFNCLIRAVHITSMNRCFHCRRVKRINENRLLIKVHVYRCATALLNLKHENPKIVRCLHTFYIFLSTEMVREETRQAEPTLALLRLDFWFTTKLLISMRCSRAYRSRLLGFVFCLQVNRNKPDCNEDSYKLTQQSRKVVPSPAIIPLKSKGHLSSGFRSIWINK